MSNTPIKKTSTPVGPRSAADELIAELRRQLDVALRDFGIVEAKRTAIIERLTGENHRTGFWPLIEDYASASWVIGTYEGRAAGLAAARAVLMTHAGIQFGNGDDDQARTTRSLARLLDDRIVTADDDKIKARKERRH